MGYARIQLAHNEYVIANIVMSAGIYNDFPFYIQIGIGFQLGLCVIYFNKFCQWHIHKCTDRCTLYSV